MKIPWNSRAIQVVLPLLLGLSAFFLVVGPRILNPTDIAWLPVFFDPPSHYLGWQFFRNAEWSFPIGLNPDFGLELGNAIVFSDSNPLLAFVFKPFSSLLPENFQYIGLWLLICFLLQAWFAWRLVGLVAESPAVRLLGAGLFVFAPPMLWRMPSHSSLAGHFLILAALYLMLRPDRQRRALSWVLVLTVAALVHPYLLVMVAALWLADLAQAWARRERPTRLAALELLGLPAIVGFACWQAGYFTIGTGVSAAGFGSFRMNLLAPLDPQGWSYGMKSLPAAWRKIGEHEGFNYLGFGVVVLALFAMPALIAGHTGLLAAARRRVILSGTLAGLFLFALSNKIGIGPLQIELPLAEPLLRAASIFRCSGRMFWPLFYVLVLAMIFVVVRGYGTRTAIVLLAFALAIQAVDTSAGWRGIQKRLAIAPAPGWVTPLQGPFWDQAAARYRKVRWVPPVNLSPHWHKLAAYAGRHGLSTDAVYLARVDPRALEGAQKRALAAVNTGRYEADSLYLLNPNLLASAARHIDPTTDLLARVDGFVLVAPGWKGCRACGHLDQELSLADLPSPPAVGGAGGRLRFSQSGGGLPEAAGEGPEAERSVPSLPAEKAAKDNRLPPEKSRGEGIR